MQLKQAMERLYKLLTNDEILLRLLSNIPKNSLDDPLDPKKPNIMDMPIEKRYEIVENVILPSDKKFELDVAPKMCRLCFYTGSRQPQKHVQSLTGRQASNAYVSTQRYNFDVYVHVDIDATDFRLTAICDRIDELLLLKNNTDIGKFVLDFSSLIENTPTGMLGYKLVYSTSSSQV